MTPPLLILAPAPIPGKAYALTPVIGDIAAQTAVCREMTERRRLVGASGIVYHFDLWRFVNEATGEILEVEVEVNE